MLLTGLCTSHFQVAVDVFEVRMHFRSQLAAHHDCDGSVQVGAEAPIGFVYPAVFWSLEGGGVRNIPKQLPLRANAG
jgi:hypothetical protein